jgi:hypothetical protein
MCYLKNIVILHICIKDDFSEKEGTFSTMSFHDLFVKITNFYNLIYDRLIKKKDYAKYAANDEILVTNQ